MNKKRIGIAIVAGACGLLFSMAAVTPAFAHSATSAVRSYPGGNIRSYVYIQDWADANNCGSFNTHAVATTKLSYITNDVSWDPIGIGASASVRGVGVSVSGNNGASPAATVTNKGASYAGISGSVCASWSTIYLGVFSDGATKVNGTLYTTSAHV